MTKSGNISKRDRRIWRDFVVRAVALFFLLSATADLTMPQIFCRGELGGKSGAVASPRTSAQLDEVQPLVSDLTIRQQELSHLPQQQNDQVPHEEDCFCCCTHVLPSFFMPPLAAISVSHTAHPSREHQSPPLPIPADIYHPPQNRA